MKSKKIRVEYGEVYSADGRTWKEIAQEAHSVSANALVNMREVLVHVDKGFIPLHARYDEITEALYPGSMEANEAHRLPVQMAAHEFEAGGNPGADEPTPSEPVVFDQGEEA